MLLSPSLPLADYRKSLIVWWVGYPLVMPPVRFEKIQCISIDFSDKHKSIHWTNVSRICLTFQNIISYSHVLYFFEEAESCLFVFPKIKINGSKILGEFSGDLDTTHCKVQLWRTLVLSVVGKLEVFFLISKYPSSLMSCPRFQTS